MKHVLKTWPQWFEMVWRGTKLFEVRFNDRGFQVGDELLLREWDPVNEFYSGRQVSTRVTCVVPDDLSGIEPGHCVLGLSPKMRRGKAKER